MEYKEKQGSHDQYEKKKKRDSRRRRDIDKKEQELIICIRKYENNRKILKKQKNILEKFEKIFLKILEQMKIAGDLKI